jgi:hypothetical protein
MAREGIAGVKQAFRLVLPGETDAGGILAA